MKDVFNIVLTGGPCGGKTTAITVLQQVLTENGYGVLIVPEAATYYIQNGVKPFGDNAIRDFQFERVVMRHQVQEELAFKQVAIQMPAAKVVILYDRGIMDDKSYVSEHEFRVLLQENRLTEISAIDRYDAVFHLVTAADGAEEAYTLTNNAARTESIEEAIRLDQKGIANWSGHQDFHIIDNSTDFDTKISRLVQQVLNVIGNPIAYTYQKKLLIEKPTQEVINQFMESIKTTKISIVQNYLHTFDAKVERKIVQRSLNGEYSYYFVEMRDNNNLSRSIKRRIIGPREYKENMHNSNAHLHQIVKDRYCFIYNGIAYRMDLYPFDDKKAMLEVMVSSEGYENVKVPEFIKVIRDVTEDLRYRNYAIAQWQKL